MVSTLSMHKSPSDLSVDRSHWLSLQSHYMRPSTDLIDFAWGALQMHCGSVRYVGSVVFSHLISYIYIHTSALLAGSDLIGCKLRLQRLVPCTLDTPPVIRRRTHVV